MTMYIKKKLLFTLITVLVFTSQLFMISNQATSIEKPVNSVEEPILHQHSTRSTTLYVGGTGQNNYTTIQQALDNTTNGDSVFVYDDSSPYNECLMITNEIHLIGENKHTTNIIGSGSEAVITINAGYVTITGFSIQKNETDKRISYGISLDYGYSIIYNTIISDMDYAIIGGGYQCQIINNQFINCGLYPSLSYYRTINNNTVNGKPLVFLNGENGKIVDNAGQVIIENCFNINIHNLTISELPYGIYLYKSPFCKIKNNVLTNSNIIIEKSDECVICDNHISIDNKRHIGYDNPCICLLGSNINLIHGNTVTSVYGTGIYICYSDAIVITRNAFIKNTEGLFISDSHCTIIHHNNFKQNFIPAHFLDSSLTSWKGNYWSRMRFLPKIIIGRKTIVPAGFMNPPVYIPWFNCDFFPSTLPNIIF